MFRKQPANPSEEWVIDIFDQTVPLKAPVAFIESLLIMVVCYCMFNAGSLTAVQIMDYVSTPKSTCMAGSDTCSYCIPYADGVKIAWNCTTVNIGTGRVIVNYTYATNTTFSNISRGG